MHHVPVLARRAYTSSQERWLPNLRETLHSTVQLPAASWIAWPRLGVSIWFDNDLFLSATCDRFLRIAAEPTGLVLGGKLRGDP